jgi:hypothetical protein
MGIGNTLWGRPPRTTTPSEITFGKYHRQNIARTDNISKTSNYRQHRNDSNRDERIKHD